jgi:hypothetical protein
MSGKNDEEQVTSTHMIQAWKADDLPDVGFGCASVPTRKPDAQGEEDVTVSFDDASG